MNVSQPGDRLVIADPALVLLVGPSGAGKSTFAAAHFAPTEVVSSDAVRAALTDDVGDQGASAEAFQILALIVNGRLKRRLMTVVDATNLRAANRRQYARLASRYGVPSVVVAFDLPLEAYRLRNVGRPDRLVDEHVVDDQAARMAGVLEDVANEGHAAVHVITADAPAGVAIVREPRR